PPYTTLFRSPGVLSPARDRRPRPVPPRDELLRPDEARRAGPGADPEGAGPVQEAGKGVPAEPLRDRRAGEDRQVPRAPRPEGSVGRELLLHPGQPERGAAAARARAEGLFADRGDPGNTLPARRGQLLRGQERRGRRAAPASVGRLR